MLLLLFLLLLHLLQVKERKPFRPAQGVGHTKLSTSIMFRGMRA